MYEIKFRIFSVDGKRAIGTLSDLDKGISLKDKDIIVIQPRPGDYIEQYTGLKDKNGVEIYEGDIVKMYDSGRAVLVSIGPQKHEENYGDMFGYVGCNLQTVGGYAKEYNLEYNIIGNIHENPELLE